MLLRGIDRHGPVPGRPPGSSARRRSTRSSRWASCSRTRRPACSTWRSGRRPTSRPRCTSRPGSSGAGESCPSVRAVGGDSGPRPGAAARAADLPPPPHGRRRCQAGGDDRPVGRHPDPVRPARQLQGDRRQHARSGIVPDGATVFYDPFGVYRFSRNELVSMGIAVVATLGLLALFRFTRCRAAHAGRGREPADDRAQRHRRRPGLGLRLGPVVAVRRSGRRAHRPPLQHPGRRRLLQPGGGRHRRGRHRPAGEPAVGLGRRPRPRRAHRPHQHLPAPLDRTQHVAASPSRTTSRRRCRSSCCSPSSCSCPASAAPRTPATRSPTSTRRPARSALSCATAGQR